MRLKKSARGICCMLILKIRDKNFPADCADAKSKQAQWNLRKSAFFLICEYLPEWTTMWREIKHW